MDPDPRLERISLLRCLSITEIVFGILGAVGLIFSFTRQGAHVGGSVGNLILTVLLLAAGAFGFHAIKKARLRDYDSQSFRICGILNIVLAVLYFLELLVLIVGGILLAVSRTAGLQLLQQFGLIHSPTAVYRETAEIDRLSSEIDRHYGRTEAPYYGRTEATYYETVIGVVVIVALVIAILICILMIALTGTAAKIARRNQAIIETTGSGAVAGYPMASPPGYGQYGPVKTQEVYRA